MSGTAAAVTATARKPSFDVAEYDFRYYHRIALGYSDIDRTLAAIRGVEDKRLIYRQPH